MPRKNTYFFSLLTAIIFASTALYAEDSLNLNNVVTCTVHSCPMIAPILRSNEELTDQVIVYETSSRPEFMERSEKAFSQVHNHGWQHIRVNQSVFSQTEPTVGFGGSFTDSAAILWNHLAPFLKNALIQSYFSATGLAYSLGRVPIASCDFSCRQMGKEGPEPSLDACSMRLSKYSYADEPDATLSQFALQPEDTQFKIPMIKAAMRAAEINHQAPLRLFASPWSAPAWMKTNGDMVHGSIIPQFQQLWADYFIKFLQHYKQQQITFWGLTVQNEPDEGGILGAKHFQTWQTLYLTVAEEANFIKHYLGPTLKKFATEYGSPIHLMIHDDQIMTLKERVTMMQDAQVAQYVDGAGLHWYTNIDIFYANLDKAYQTLNNTQPKRARFILGTEACEGYIPPNRGPSLGNWSRGEAYAHDIMNDIHHHVSGWTDWNLLLDKQGGPNWARNYVDAPIIADIKNQRFYKQPMYFYLGHFSKFIRPGSRLLQSQSLGPFALEEASFKVPAHGSLPETIVIVVLNRGLTPKKYYIQEDTIANHPTYLNMHIPSHSIQTIIYKSKN